eukprot:scaffold86439_cov29-Tisochrysis_lutea.AAC.2
MSFDSANGGETSRCKSASADGLLTFMDIQKWHHRALESLLRLPTGACRKVWHAHPDALVKRPVWLALEHRAVSGRAEALFDGSAQTSTQSRQCHAAAGCREPIATDRLVVD